MADKVNTEYFEASVALTAAIEEYIKIRDKVGFTRIQTAGDILNKCCDAGILSEVCQMALLQDKTVGVVRT